YEDTETKQIIGLVKQSDITDQVNVEWFMIDYEAAAWQAIREVFQRALVRGCVFHWTQRIYRQVIRLGLSATYTQGGDTYQFIRKILALPFLPSEHIPGAFTELQTLANLGAEPVNRLVDYVNSKWISGNIWRPDNWSVFRETVRTNNDVEGWHRGINSRANGSKLPFYVLVPLLRSEAEDVTITVRLVSEHIVTRTHREKYKKIHQQLFNMWDKYENQDDYSTSQLLRECSHLVGIGPIPASIDDHGDDD
ncbi:uncharacterized protein LOC123563591, partial [Mercenaria mercenaria]|uniref:uncharacterized protein LOC123563591 n=1 Tax=Mercenaria mercenaria TaxID=6596 RepID=UPI00234F3179